VNAPATEAATGDLRPMEAAEIVSEALWEQWRTTAREQALGSEPLGRFASSLRHLPRVLWNTPIEAYTDLTLADLRGLKTHGVKRVAAVLEVFRGLHTMLVYAGTQGHLVTRVVPRFAAQIESWIVRRLPQAAAIGVEQFGAEVVTPLLEQIRLDVGALGTELARIRLVPGETNVQQTAHRLQTTRSRVYETAAETAAALAVRWPKGPTILAELRERQADASADREAQELVDSIVLLFSPITRGDSDPTPSARRPRVAVVAHGRRQPSLAHRNGSVATGRT
jgi:hypothetical protein